MWPFKLSNSSAASWCSMKEFSLTETAKTSMNSFTQHIDRYVSLGGGNFGQPGLAGTKIMMNVRGMF